MAQDPATAQGQQREIGGNVTRLGTQGQPGGETFLMAQDQPSLQSLQREFEEKTAQLARLKAQQDLQYVRTRPVLTSEEVLASVRERLNQQRASSQLGSPASRPSVSASPSPQSGGLLSAIVPLEPKLDAAVQTGDDLLPSPVAEVSLRRNSGILERTEYDEPSGANGLNVDETKSVTVTESDIIQAVEAQQVADRLEKDPALRSFAERSVKIIEKSVNTDRILGIYRDLNVLNSVSQASDVAARFSSSLMTYSQLKLTALRPVVDIVPIPQSSEFYVAYGAKEGDPMAEYKSVVLRWALGSPKRPEAVLASPSAEVSCMCVLPEDPNTVIAGTTSGCLMMWCVPVGGSGEAVRPMQTRRTKLHHIIEVSGLEDHRLICIDQIHQLLVCAIGASIVVEKEKVLKTPAVQRYFGLLTACFNGVEELYCGGDDGSLYICPIKSMNDYTAGKENKASDFLDASTLNSMGLATGSFTRSGSGPLATTPTGIPGQYPGCDQALTCSDVQRFSNSPLLVTGSLYWTMTLWQKNLNHNLMVPLLTFEHQPSTTYTTGVAWSPSSPNLFASCNLGGYLSFWNIAQGTRWQNNPLLSTPMDNGALTNVVFSSDGKRLIIGSAKGTVIVAPVPKSGQ